MQEITTKAFNVSFTPILVYNIMVAFNLTGATADHYKAFESYLVKFLSEYEYEQLQTLAQIFSGLVDNFSETNIAISYELDKFEATGERKTLYGADDKSSA